MPTLNRPRESTVRRLYALSMNRCAYLDCPTQIVTPETGAIVGEVCHIRSQSVGGPRYLASQTDEERHGFENLILMCGNHHKEIDTPANLAIYTEEWLFDTKRTHEEKARELGEITAPTAAIQALVWTVAVYEAGSTHMDFRNATFKVGGEGGQGPGSAGGSGGVLTIVGIASLPREIAQQMTIDLAGGHGEEPGAGGGGGGVLAFEGRPVTEADIADGLQVPLFFPANSIQVADNMWNVLGAGWEYFWVPQFPCSTYINLAFLVEFGSVDPNVLLGFEFSLKDPVGNEHILGIADSAVPEAQGMISRRCETASFPAGFTEPGLYELSMHSGVIRFARYTFEVKLRSRDAHASRLGSP
ncbi:hypothetical protein [Mycobacterium sp.]|uniref:hypothetical protein n=1 Tax=Mycobacterium sp. TaxID=1785 RepID=UPI0026131BE9|nr:hypothetical protein [Mycobacterium sp.]